MAFQAIQRHASHIISAELVNCKFVQNRLSPRCKLLSAPTRPRPAAHGSTRRPTGSPLSAVFCYDSVEVVSESTCRTESLPHRTLNWIQGSESGAVPLDCCQAGKDCKRRDVTQMFLAAGVT